MIHNHKKYLLIDFFGVIAKEVAPFWFNKYFSEECALKLQEEIFSDNIDIKVNSEYEMYDILSKLINKTPKEIEHEMLALVFIDDKVISILRSLKKKYIIVLCSNACSGFVRKIIKDHDLSDIFSEMYISSEMGVAKPNVQFFQKVLNQSKILEKEAFFIDDNQKNIDVAESLGIESILFKNTSTLQNL